MPAQTIVYTEEMVGSGHPTKADTLNRLALVEHDTDGTHLAAPMRTIISAYLPWLIDIDAFAYTPTHLNWTTVTVPGVYLNELYMAHLITSGAQNDWISWPVVLAAGTWTVILTAVTHTDAGIYSIQFDDVEKATYDSYAVSGPNYSVRSTTAGIAVATTAKITLKLKMATKHASSSSYYGRLQHVRLLRTA